jgi:hypothetical protein
MPDAQTIWSAVLTLVNLVVGGAVVMLRDSLRELQAADAELTTKVQAIEVLVAGEYIRRGEFDRVAERIFSKLDAIERKLDTKVSRADCPVIHAAQETKR